MTSSTPPPPHLLQNTMIFQTDIRSSRAEQCTKSRALTKVVGISLPIRQFEHQCVINKVVFQTYQPEKHMITIGVDQSLINSAIYEHRRSENIEKLCKSSCKCVNQ